MRKDLGKFPAVFPMPVLMVAAYDEHNQVNVMNAAWGMISSMDTITLFIDEDHKTTQNILKTKSFSVSIATTETMAEADYFGIVSGHTVPDKFERSQLTLIKSERSHAPIIDEFPICMECELLEEIKTNSIYAVVGKIINVSADTKVLNEKGKVDVSKLNALIFDQFQAGYYAVSNKVGNAWIEGKVFVKKD